MTIFYLGAAVSLYALLCSAALPFWKACENWVLRHRLAHLVCLACAIYWATGYIFLIVHTDGGSIITTHARPTLANQCLAAFYRPWFICCLGLGFDTAPVEWDAP
jgi:hypothetical protein